MSSQRGSSNDCIPQHVLNFLDDTLSHVVGIDDCSEPHHGTSGNNHSSKGRWSVVQSVEAAKSAQQRVWIVAILPTQNVNAAVDVQPWTDALCRGGNRLVVRQWRGASRWWNVNHPVEVRTALSFSHQSSDSPMDEESIRRATLIHIAQQEVWGYQSARQALDTDSIATDDGNLHERKAIRIPQLLHFESNVVRNVGANDDEYPWAVLEYVGPASTLYGTVVPDDSWIAQMVPIRDEFGFPEPHPRWGRVPENDSLVYALMVLRSVMLPIHTHYLAALCAPVDPGNPHSNAPIQYSDMVDLYQSKLKSCLQPAGQTYSSENATHPLDTYLPKLQRALERLHQIKGTIEPMPSVLCHMDYQPQNLCFAQHSQSDNVEPPDSTVSSWIASVLDWEEAAYADPRFDLLMLCRKVCCNRQQADDLWHVYATEISHHPALDASPLRLGSIEPWLALETVHSITTLLLQAIAGGGRNSWESQGDLWSKIDRECKRLEHMGWKL